MGLCGEDLEIFCLFSLGIQDSMLATAMPAAAIVNPIAATVINLIPRTISTCCLSSSSSQGNLALLTGLGGAVLRRFMVGCIKKH